MLKYFHLQASFACFVNNCTKKPFSASNLSSCWFILYWWRAKKGWLAMCLILLLHIPVLFMTSLTQTAWHKMVVLFQLSMSIFNGQKSSEKLLSLSFHSIPNRNQVEKCRASLFLPFQTDKDQVKKHWASLLIHSKQTKIKIKWKTAEPLFSFCSEQTEIKWKTAEPLFSSIPTNRACDVPLLFAPL